jgi:hypothetical protein
VLGFGVGAPSDTAQQPADLLVMGLSVPGVGPAIGASIKGLMALAADVFPGVAETLGPLLSRAARCEGAGSVPQALGRGSTANLSKGTTLARNLREQLAIEQAMSNPAAGAKLPLKMTDPRWPASEGWVKMQQVIQPGGEPINVHYLLNEATGAIDDFKIVLPDPR